MCLYPRLLKNRKYTWTKKNNGNVPKLYDERIKYVSVGCGKCMECLRKKSSEWRIRLLEDIKYNSNQCTFVTLTFSQEALYWILEQLEEGNRKNNDIATYAVRHFLENWRKHNKKSIRHWLVTELGHQNTERIHLHGIIWSTDHKEIKKHWKYGWIYIGQWVNEITINYIVKYITKTDLQHPNYTPKILCSKGIGKIYIQSVNARKNTFSDVVNEETNELYTTRQGAKLALPNYYRNLLYTEDEREELWLQKLNKQTRYINGIAIDISTNEGMETYERALKEAQKLNKKLGYGDDKKDWNEELYHRTKNRLNKITKTKK